MTVYDLTLAELRAKLDKREISAVEVTKTYLDRIAATNPALNTFITICDETALAEAQAADQAIAEGKAQALTGLPIAA
jgi:aspartyl-tRNA(Asn)/glutamyl-tRNA(Gln) amidotransferase subunit A